MQLNPFKKTALQILIILSTVFSAITAYASCGWVVISTVCATDPDPHGAFCNDGQINCFCGAQLIPPVFYDQTDVTKKDRCKQASWWPNVCHPYLLQERTWEWQPDSNDPCCNNPDRCCNSSDKCCGHEDDPCCKDPGNPCCGDPCACKCCDGNDSGEGPPMSRL